MLNVKLDKIYNSKSLRVYRFISGNNVYIVRREHTEKSKPIYIGVEGYVRYKYYGFYNLILPTVMIY